MNNKQSTGKIYLITGGCRSGKSSYAQELAEKLDTPRCFIATCPVIDEEMDDRIVRHQKDRENKNWQTIEEERDLATAIKNCDANTMLIDCLALWVNNLMYKAEVEKTVITEDIMTETAFELLSECRNKKSDIIFVTNEVGMSIIPENASARLYRDLIGRCNQAIAKEADEVFLVTCGIPMKIK